MTPAEVEALLALPEDVRAELRDGRGPGWACFPGPVAVPQMRPQPTYEAWLPADLRDVVIAWEASKPATEQPVIYITSDTRWAAHIQSVAFEGDRVIVKLLEVTAEELGRLAGDAGKDEAERLRRALDPNDCPTHGWPVEHKEGVGFVCAHCGKPR